ncbi:hypothetical protein LUZ60_012401 [Juncus effusus]|nr:hypothetical protein LUZ60_012401 [Juncus effusus]
MVYYAIEFTAELEGLTNLQPRGGCDDPSHPYFFKLKCENCGEISQKSTCVSLSDEVPLSNGKGTVHLVQKCKFCGREGTVLMLPGHGEPLTGQQGQNGQFARLMVFESRGFELFDFIFQDGWKAESESGEEFEIDLSEGEFADYDEKAECPIGVSNLKSQFKVVKKQGTAGKTQFR